MYIPTLGSQHIFYRIIYFFSIDYVQNKDHIFKHLNNIVIMMKILFSLKSAFVMCIYRALKQNRNFELSLNIDLFELKLIFDSFLVKV